jgi:hypothetical protein
MPILAAWQRSRPVRWGQAYLAASHNLANTSTRASSPGLVRNTGGGAVRNTGEGGAMFAYGASIREF